MKIQFQLDRVITLLVVAGMAFFLLTELGSIVSSWQANQAIDACSGYASVTYTTPDGATVREPGEKWFETCLKEKGLR